jgi:hypothetical protein
MSLENAKLEFLEILFLNKGSNYFY